MLDLNMEMPVRISIEVEEKKIDLFFNLLSTLNNYTAK